MTMARATVPRFVHPERRRDSDVIGVMLKQAYEVGSDAFCTHHLAMMKRPDYRPVLSKISCPTVIIAGKQDLITRAASQFKMADAIKGAQTVLIDKCAHMATIEQPEKTLQAMRQWLTVEEKDLAA